MEVGPVGGPELIILALLFIFGLWWFLSFLPGKMALAASTLLVSFSIRPAPIPEIPQPVEEAPTKALFL